MKVIKLILLRKIKLYKIFKKLHDVYFLFDYRYTFNVALKPSNLVSSYGHLHYIHYVFLLSLSKPFFYPFMWGLISKTPSVSCYHWNVNMNL